jgi:U-box domain
MEIVSELEEVSFSMDQSEKEAGDEIISLLQKNRKPKDTNSTDSAELETFHQAALKLGITSSRAVLTERRSLKKLIERAQLEEDKRKESVLSYLYHLIRKYSKLFRSEFGDDTDSQGSAPCSPTVLGFEDSYGSCGGISRVFDRNLSKIRSFNFRPSGFRSGNLSVPPEELRCPISLQLMYDPVIISSGQTYERVCIEKWFNDGHKTCPKTQQELAHLCLTPNYCVKGLIASWCEHNGFPLPESPPGNFDISWSVESGDSNNRKSVEVVPSEESCVSQMAPNSNCGIPSPSHALDGNNEGYSCLLAMLDDEKSTSKKYKLVEQIRYVLKDDAESRIQMGANGFAEALVRFLRLAVYDGDEKAQEMGAMALFNLTVSNSRCTSLFPLIFELCITFSLSR